MSDLDKLNTIIEDLDTQSKDLKNFNEVTSEIKDLRDSITGSLDALKNYNRGLEHISEDVSERLDDFKKQLEVIGLRLDEKVQELYQDNKKFQKELDNSLSSRLEKHKSDIEVAIRNEGSQIQRGVETTLNSNFNAIDRRLDEGFDTQNKKIGHLKVLIYITIALSLGIVVGVYI